MVSYFAVHCALNAMKSHLVMASRHSALNYDSEATQKNNVCGFCVLYIDCITKRTAAAAAAVTAAAIAMNHTLKRLAVTSDTNM